MSDKRRNSSKAEEDEFKDIPHIRKEPRPDFSKQPLERKKLPQSIQDTLDHDEKLWEVLAEGRAPESTDSNVRYAGYAARVRTILLSAQRYVAYTSDIGESFRPVAHPYLVKGAYAVSWLYLGGDVAHEGYKAYLRNQRILHPEQHGMGASGTDKPAVSSSKEATPGASSAPSLETAAVSPGKIPAIEDYRAVMAQRATFQAIASMGLPAVTIHSIVRYSGQAMKNVKNVKVRTWGPIGLGLAAVPFLPYIFDHPVETAVEAVFHKSFAMIGGPEAVGHEPVIGKSALREARNQAGAAKEKEL